MALLIRAFAGGWLLEGGVDECGRAAFEDVLHDVSGWFLSVCWFGLVVRVRRSGAVVMAVIDGGGPVVFIGGWC